ncbi:MAG: CsbD family protein [Candidatus Acidiferrales bacterium]
MNWDQVEGKWKQYTGEIRERWSKLTDDDIHIIAGKREQLIGRLQERYGLAKEVAAHEADEFVRELTEEPEDSNRRARAAGSR